MLHARIFHALMFAVSAIGSTCADSDGVVWTADLSSGRDAFSVELCDGAEGSVRFITTDGACSIEIEKANDIGWIVVSPKEKVVVPEGTALQSYAKVVGSRNDPEYSLGFLRMWGQRRTLRYFGELDGRGGGGLAMSVLLNTPADRALRKTCRYLADAEHGTEVTPAIVVAGKRSRSTWTAWGIEDLKSAERRWSERLKLLEPRDRTGECQDEDEFAVSLSSDIDHTAQVSQRNGVPVLLVDGKEHVPVFFKGKMPGVAGAKNHYCGRSMETNGIDVQVVTVRFGDSPKVRGWWTTKGFDAKGAAGEVRTAMRLAPKSVFVLTVILDAYPEFSEEHPDEVWRTADGRVVWGNDVHANYSLDPSTFKSRHWPWVSCSSRVWLDEVKVHLASLVDELKREGLSKRIVGIHLGGYHDHQFATRHPDFSKPAVEGFKNWQKNALGRVVWDKAPSYAECGAYLVPGRDDHQIAYMRYLKRRAFEVQEEVARLFKARIGKPTIAARWCMDAWGGTYCSTYDIAPFVKSDAIDIIAPQPNYERRLPGLAIGQRHPTASYRLNGKLMLNEFDLRTYGAVQGNESELRVTGLSQATDFYEWKTIYRKCAGQQLASRMGWWFYDMAGGWFEPPEISADIAKSMKVVKAVALRIPSAPNPAEAALVVDEDGMLLRNTVSSYYNLDEERLVGAQQMLLAGSGVPYDQLLIDDLLRDPAIVKRYRTIVFCGMYYIDRRRKALLDSLKSDGRVVVFLSGTGASGGVEATGFEIRQEESPQNHCVVAESGMDVDMFSYADHFVRMRYLGDSVSGYWQPRRISVVEKQGVKVLARYAKGGLPAVAEREGDGFKEVYICDAAGLTPQYFNALVRESGGYVAARSGLQVDMNADFASIHCLVPGRYDFRLPRECQMVDLDDGTIVSSDAQNVSLDLFAGETRWYILKGGKER